MIETMLNELKGVKINPFMLFEESDLEETGNSKTEANNNKKRVSKFVRISVKNP